MARMGRGSGLFTEAREGREDGNRTAEYGKRNLRTADGRGWTAGPTHRLSRTDMDKVDKMDAVDGWDGSGIGLFKIL